MPILGPADRQNSGITTHTPLTNLMNADGRGFIFQIATITQCPNTYKLGFFLPFSARHIGRLALIHLSEFHYRKGETDQQHREDHGTHNKQIGTLGRSCATDDPSTHHLKIQTRRGEPTIKISDRLSQSIQRACALHYFVRRASFLILIQIGMCSLN